MTEMPYDTGTAWGRTAHMEQRLMDALAENERLRAELATATAQPTIGYTFEQERVINTLLEHLGEGEHIADATAKRKRRFMKSDLMHAGLVVESDEEARFYEALAYRYEQLREEITGNLLFQRIDEDEQQQRNRAADCPNCPGYDTGSCGCSDDPDQDLDYGQI